MHALRGRLGRSGLRVALVVAPLSALLCVSPLNAAPPPARAFFALSPISAVAAPGRQATRYSVTAHDVQADDAPAYRWYLQLGVTAAASCDDARVSGGRRVSATEYEWQNQGASFVWYHATAGGCDLGRPGVAGSPGTVTVVAENEYEHCRASYAGIAGGTGPAASCALGGFTLSASTLPVPAALLSLYARLEAQLSALVARARTGALSASALSAALQPLLREQQHAFGDLFPPVWGCGFARLFDGVATAKAALAQQVAELAAGRRPAAAALVADGADLELVTRAVAACEQSPGHDGGAPSSVVAAAARLSAQAATLRGAAAGADGLSLLRARLPRLEGSLDGLVGHHFPTVFGMGFLGLVDTTLAAQSAVGVAEHAVGKDASGTALAALRGALASEHTVGQALRTQQRHVVAVENSHS